MTVSYPWIPVQFADLDHTIQDLLQTTANDLARETAFVQRCSALDGAHFAQALIFGWLADPEASYSFLQQMLEISGCDVSAQALEKRMTPQAADFLLSLLYAFTSACIASEPVMTELLSRFAGVYLQDGTVISLPSELKSVYRGCGGSTSESGVSALRVQVRLNLTTGAMQGPWVAPAVQSERTGPGCMQESPLPTDALYLTDSGYVTLHEIKAHREQGRWWMSHARADWQLTDARGVKQSLVQFIQSKGQDQSVIDEQVMIGAQPGVQQSVRLMAFAISEQRHAERQAQVGRTSKPRAKGSRGNTRVGKKHQPTKGQGHRRKRGQKRMQLSGWTLLLTNVPPERLAAHEARVLMRSRWQIELVWKLWKERGQVDIWRSAKPMRILCEVYAKLMGCMIQHWVILLGCWQQPKRSQVKASQAVTALIPAYVLSWAGPVTSTDILVGMGCAMKRSQLNTRPKRMSTAQLLERPSRIHALG